MDEGISSVVLSQKLALLLEHGMVFLELCEILMILQQKLDGFCRTWLFHMGLWTSMFVSFLYSIVEFCIDIPLEKNCRQEAAFW
jgi:hypothetical protein